MAIKKYTCPPQPASGAGTFSDDLVGFQLAQGGGFTQGNFTFSNRVTEKTNRTFNTGVFSDPISLEGLNINDINQSKAIFENNFKVYPNFDLSQITNFTLYGSMVKRISSSIEKIINYFPAAIESLTYGSDYTTGNTATNISYDASSNQTRMDFKVSRLRNPFEIDFTVNAARNLSLREVQVSNLRNLTDYAGKYSLYIYDKIFPLVRIVPTTSLTSGVLTVYVKGNATNGTNYTSDNIVIRPNDYEVNKITIETFDEVEKFLLNTNTSPKYTAVFNLPQMSDDGNYYTVTQNLTWPVFGLWNLDIITPEFTSYLTQLNNISQTFDSYKTNLIARFFVTDAFLEFDTNDQKISKLLQIYGRSFDETKKFIDALAYMNSVHYNVGNDIPSQLLKNLAQTLGWNIKMSPISNEDFLQSVFGDKDGQASDFSGVDKPPTPDELNYQFYRNVVLNSAYLFKSKGTRKSCEILLRLIGAPDAIVEFNEHVYLADQRINMTQFDKQFASISGGTYLDQIPVYDPNYVFNFQGVNYSGYTVETNYYDVNITREEYPVDNEGLPTAPEDTEDYFFQLGSGWFEQTPEHRGIELPDTSNSVFTGQNPDYQTTLKAYTYGQDYLDRFRHLPFTNLGYRLIRQGDNNKSWVTNEVGLRQNLEGGYNARYFTTNERLVLNAKNVDLFLNPAQGILYDVWYMSREFDYPIPNTGLSNFPSGVGFGLPFIFTGIQYPSRGGIDWTVINPQPKNKTFFEFAQTFWQNMINVRNRQFSSGGGKFAYPTLSSIFWKYLESENLAGLTNNNFSYKTLTEYVNGLGTYWIRLVEQMVPATTIWIGGVKYENSIFHRQKFAWRRQGGCQIVPVPCKPCKLTTSIFDYDCPLQEVTCDVYPWGNVPQINSFSSVLNYMFNQYLTSIGKTQSDYNMNSLITTWFVDINLNNSITIQNEFFNGFGLSTPISSPTNTMWETALQNALDDLKNYGYDYYLTEDDTVVIYNSICSLNESDVNISINVGINYEISCE